MNHLPVTSENELQKCKEDPVYFYEKYVTVNGDKPRPLTKSEKKVMRTLAKRELKMEMMGYGPAMNNAQVGFTPETMIVQRVEAKKKRRNS